MFELGALESGYVCSGHRATFALGSSRFPAESASCFPELLPHEAGCVALQALRSPPYPTSPPRPAPGRQPPCSQQKHPCPSLRFCVCTEGLSPHLREASKEPAENPASWSPRASSGRRSALSTSSMSSRRFHQTSALNYPLAFIQAPAGETAPTWKEWSHSASQSAPALGDAAALPGHGQPPHCHIQSSTPDPVFLEDS